MLACRDVAALAEALYEGAGAVLLADGALSAEVLGVLNAVLNAQPDWSDLPVLYLVKDGSTHSAERLNGALGGRVFVLESPLPRITLLSAVRLALAARRQQHRVRDLSARSEALEKDHAAHLRNTAELRLSEVRFSKVFDASPVPATITTLAEGRYLEANDSALELLGFGRDEVVGRKASELSLWKQDSKTRANLLRRIKVAGSLRDVPIGFYTKSGELRSSLATFEIVELAGELCLLSLVLDVTERKRDEAELLQAVKEVMHDADWFSRSFVEKLAQVKNRGIKPGHQAEIKDLTPREQQVLERVARGQANQQIAAELKLSQNTVRNYLANTFEKLGVHTRVEAVVWARERGLGSSI